MDERQQILVFQQNGSGEAKVRGIIRHGHGFLRLQLYDIDDSLPPLIDDARNYLPEDIQADLVLDFLLHLDLSHDLSMMRSLKKIPVALPAKVVSCFGHLNI